MFSPTTTQAILSTHIPSRPKPDKFLWIPDSKGLFSVKSTYKELLPNPPPPASSNVNWSKLWKIRGPKRIKMFLWRVAVNALPTRENLIGHMDIPDSTCVLCNIEVESAPHLFLRCPIARAIWFATCWGFKSDQLGYTNDIIKCILDPPSDLCQAQDLWLVSLNMAFTLEEIWHTRNVVLHLKGSTDLQASINNIGARPRECALVFSHTKARISAHSNVRWSLPPIGTIKLNVDVAVSLSKTALAVVARNENRAVLKALQLAKGELWSNILVESDSKNIIDAILDNMGCSLWTISALVSDICFLAKSFVLYLFCWVKRSGNAIAHEIMPKSSPLVAETEAILWALQLAKGELWSNILVESDSKNIIDAILDNTGCSLWTISALVFDICFLAKSFVLCLFCWVKSGNAAAHEAAQYALRVLCPFCLSSDILPDSIGLVCKEDV
nr:putative ribonuclease h protein [Quercus suber]